VFDVEWNYVIDINQNII